MRYLSLKRCVVGNTTALALAAALWGCPGFAATTLDASRRPVILDSQGGINDGRGGTLVRTGPASWEPIVGAQQIAPPVELAPPQSSIPVIVEPRLEQGVDGGKRPHVPLRVSPPTH